eukprot:Gregarina_sp_Pseudo_9__1915@NODE_2315_length_1044_cov_4_788060_g2131_i0_p1_GENE_NODE_2315_length_1044_cov_4_788060_g2131_i0NODE_2315_length_1044_cov_4_788060_g2131_i0_p1_ORF_typecomplete_len324_score11_43YIF1/PF03878_15/2_8e39Yip1/PF04893_17/1_7e07CBP_BcsF/PF11120_8/31CBP_BcsF/PF11120_8/2_9DUF1616/PF07760_11/0_47_NODE_2315_length_1044_cov_4_788060_g2131_i090974
MLPGESQQPVLSLLNFMGNNMIPPNFQFPVNNPVIRDQVVQAISTSAVESGSTYWLRIRERLHGHFCVSHEYVIKKLLLLLFPFARFGTGLSFSRKPREARSTLDGLSYQVPSKVNSHHYQETNRDCERSVHKSDLYIPLMAFLSYVILYAWNKGTLDDFEPKVLSERATITSAAVLFETIVCWGARVLWAADGDSSFLDILATTSYKFVSLSLFIVIGLLLDASFKRIRLIALIYLVSACSISTLIMHLGSPTARDAGEWGLYRGPTRQALHVALVCAVLQIPLFYLFAPSWH